MRFLNYFFFFCFVVLVSLVADTEAQGAVYVSNHQDSIKIGFLFSDDVGQAALNGAWLAVNKANENGGFQGKPFQLVVRSMEGAWGIGSKQTVNLITEENVWAIVGSHDSRNAHLVEQAATKLRIVFLSAWAGDPTLSQAFIPWFFSCIPNYVQQAERLIQEIHSSGKSSKIALISDDGYESKLALNSFVKKMKIQGYQEPLTFFYTNSQPDFNLLLNSLKKDAVDCIVLFGNPSASAKFIFEMRERKMQQVVFGALSLLAEDGTPFLNYSDKENIIFPTSVESLKPNGLEFKKNYLKNYGKMPGAIAAYAFDGMNVIIEAIRNSGGDREMLQKAVSASQFEGVTGMIQFDEKGNRLRGIELIQLKNGVQLRNVK